MTQRTQLIDEQLVGTNTRHDMSHRVLFHTYFIAHQSSSPQQRRCLTKHKNTVQRCILGTLDSELLYQYKAIGLSEINHAH